CPAHDDHSPSLSIRQADDRVLLRCWAGCRVENICTALGIALADLYDDARHSRPDTVAHRRRLAAEGLEKWRQTQLQRCAEELRQHDELIRRVDAAVRDSAVTEDEAWDQLEAAYRGYSELEYRFERLLQNQDVLQIW